MKNLKNIILIIILYLLSYITSITNLSNKEFKISFLDIGQGDCIFVETDGKRIIIDGGPDNVCVYKVSEKLLYWNRKIDYMILTHPHADHIMSLIELLDRVEIGNIILTGIKYSNVEYKIFLAKIREENINTIYITKQQKIKISNNSELNFLYPLQTLKNQEINNLNNSSVVAKINFNEYDFLLTGDIEKEVEEELLNENINMESEILKLGHHGSNTSSTKKFLTTVNPEYVVIQVGAENSHNHPSQRVLYNLEALNITNVLRNDYNGDIVFYVSDDKLNYFVEK